MRKEEDVGRKRGKERKCCGEEEWVWGMKQGVGRRNRRCEGREVEIMSTLTVRECEKEAKGMWEMERVCGRQRECWSRGNVGGKQRECETQGEWKRGKKRECERQGAWKRGKKRVWGQGVCVEQKECGRQRECVRRSVREGEVHLRKYSLVQGK